MYYKSVLVPISFASWKMEVPFVSSVSCALVERWQKMIKFLVCVIHDLSNKEEAWSCFLENSVGTCSSFNTSL